jgi:Rad3-related DNA helicase
MRRPVKRYDWRADCTSPEAPEEWEGGDYVLWEDYAIEYEQHDWTQRQLQQSKDFLKLLNEGYEKLKQELEELQDAVEYFSNHLYDNRYMIETTVELRQNMSKEESNIYDAIKASKRRMGDDE